MNKFKITEGKDNNFNLIRLIAAFMVLITHSFTVAYGGMEHEPFRDVSLMSIGNIAVYIFFVTSGFLVTGSLIRTQSVADYLVSRALRIFPALIVMLLITVFLVFPWLSSRSLADYFSSPDVYTYFLKCSILLLNVEFSLPGVFLANPYADNVNGSLWTLPVELYLYIGLVVFWITIYYLTMEKISSRESLLRKCILVATILLAILLLLGEFRILTPNVFTLLTYLFFSGSSLFLFRERITLSAWAFGFCVALMVASAFISPIAFAIAFVTVIPYVLIFFAYFPSTALRKFNSFGDYSYGIYIYSFPIQQTIVYLYPDSTVMQITVFSGVASFLFAYLSWHIIEKRALALKRTLLSRHDDRAADINAQKA